MTDDTAFVVEVDDSTPPVVRVAGDIDMDTSPIVSTVIAGLVKSGRAAALVFDMTGVTFVDSSGLAVLVEATRLGSAVTLRNPSTIVRRVIAATGLDGVLAVEA